MFRYYKEVNGDRFVSIGYSDAISEETPGITTISEEEYLSILAIAQNCPESSRHISHALGTDLEWHEVRDEEMVEMDQIVGTITNVTIHDISEAMEFRVNIDRAVKYVPDEVALDMTNLFPVWSKDFLYENGERVTFNGVLYKCLNSHESQESWTPLDTPSLWAQVLIPDPEVIPEWIQPGAENGYSYGDKVTHNGTVWISTFDGFNVWEPGLYSGWEAVQQ